MDQLLLKNKVITQKLVTYGHELGQTLGDGEGQGGLRAAVHGVTKCRTQQGDTTTTRRLLFLQNL